MLGGDKEVAKQCLRMPYPYPDGEAERWISSHDKETEHEREDYFAITSRSDSEFIGAISLRINKADHRGEIGYWVGAPFWNKGYATEAAREILRYGFIEARLNKIIASCFADNPGSSKVLQNIGMKLEGSRPQQYYHFGEYRDSLEYGLLKVDWEASLD